VTEDIFEQLAAERLFVPDRPDVEDAQQLPAVTPPPEFDWFQPIADLDQMPPEGQHSHGGDA
jgi:hypothetical protein